jgi:hypothetical protein
VTCNMSWYRCIVFPGKLNRLRLTGRWSWYRGVVFRGAWKREVSRLSRTVRKCHEGQTKVWEAEEAEIDRHHVGRYRVVVFLDAIRR